MRITFFSTLAAVSATTYDRYGGSYTPTTQITDYAALDLDQYELNLQLSNRKLMPAFHMYRSGGYSGSYAVLTLQNLSTSSASSYPAGTTVYGQTFAGSQVVGYLANAANWAQGADEKEIEVVYAIGDVQDDYLDCQVGGLWHFSQANRRGCFNDAGVVTLVNQGEDPASASEFEYVYDTRRDNRNQHTLQKLSTDAVDSMIMPVSKKYFSEFQAFLEYYGDADYGDKWVVAAHNKEPTAFSNDRGQADFTIFAERMGTGEAIKKGIAYLNIWMQVVRHIQAAAELCGSPDAAAELDKAVALYTGSLTTDPDETSGILLYGLADIRSHQFKTSGIVGDMDSGTAHVNVQVMSAFQELQGILNAQKSSLCGATVTQTKDAIINYMKVPLLQGVLRYTYIRDKDIRDFNLDDTERTKAESAVFAASILPLVHQCSPSAARTLHDHTKVHATKTDFKAVQKALENTYDCLNVSCELVGGVWDHEDQSYRKGGKPCGGIHERSPAASFFKFCGIALAVVAVAFLGMKYRYIIARHVTRVVQRKQSPPPPAMSGNIAAVAEIS